VQEAEGEPSLAELQEKLKLGSQDKTPLAVNGRRADKGLNAAVFDDFWCLQSPTESAVHNSAHDVQNVLYLYWLICLIGQWF